MNRSTRPLIASTPGRRLAATGFSMVEVLVSLAIFTLVIIAAYNVYIRSLETSKRGTSASEMTQSGRVALDQLVHEIRLAGFEYDVDGPLTSYPQMPDEPIEFMHERAISIRANFDGDDEFGGREPALEYVDPDPSSTDNVCCPIVTTGNDEIITYALGKSPGDPDQPNDTIEMRYDTTGTQDDPAPDGTYDENIRDATISSDTIAGEEDVVIDDVHLGEPNDPPYTLYRFYWDDGQLQRQPLVDNVSSLRFVYYDEQGNEVTPTGGGDDGTGSGDDRAARASVRRVDVFVEVLEAEPDLRWNDPDAPNEYAQKRRKYEFSSTVIPPNLGTRGQIDRSINPPSPPTNVQVTTGCCEWIRVEWEPPPVEERVKDYVVTLFESPPNPNDISNVVASFIVQSKLDLTQTPPREYATFNRKDDFDIFNGREIWAQVVARSEGGAESEPAPEEGGPQVSAVVQQASRPGPLQSARATGYEAAPLTNDWPDADPANIGGVPIETTEGLEHSPRHGRIEITLEPPAFVLNEGASTGEDEDGTNWTTKPVDGTAVVGALDGQSEATGTGKGYHLAESTPSDDDDDLRTPFGNAARSNEGTVYVFRVSGSASWNWDGEDDANASVAGGVAINDPRNFIPGPANLHDFARLNLDGNTATYVDDSDYSFSDWGDPADLSDDRFDSTTRRIPAVFGSSAEPARAVAPGEVYYYRFRVVDLCWEDSNRDGRDDVTGTRAWEIAEDNADALTWRTEAMAISPFYPPLNPQGGSDEEPLTPNPGVDDSDAIVRTSGIDAYAIPGYALPLEDAGDDPVAPAAPNELYLAKKVGNDLLANEGARPVFNASRRSVVIDGDAWASIPAIHYVLHRVPANGNPDAGTAVTNLDFTPSSTNAFVRFVTDDPQSLLRFTIDRSGGTDGDGAPVPAPTTDACATFLDAEGEPPSSTDVDDLLRLNCLGEARRSTGNPYVYRLVAHHAPDWGLDDGIDFSSASDPSPAFVFPCNLYDQLRSLDVTPDPNGSNTTSVAVSVEMNEAIDDDTLDGDCDEIAAARLLAFTPGAQGEFIGTSDWVAWGATCDFTFAQSEVTEARRGHVGNASYRVELTTASSAIGTAGHVSVDGCRVRSDLPGNACADCGTQPPPEGCVGCATDVLLGAMSVELNAGDPSIVDLRMPVECLTADPVTLLMIEVELNQALQDVPELEAASVIDVVGGNEEGTPDELPIPGSPDYRTNRGGDPTQPRFRWYDNITSDPPSFDGSSDEIIIRLDFASDVCELTVENFNFRILNDTGGEVLCTNRTDDPAAADETNPDTPGGGGRTDTNDEAPLGTCGPTGCDPVCVNAANQGVCPLQDCDNDPETDLAAPSREIVADDGGNASRRVNVGWAQTCEDCDVTAEEFHITINKPSNCTELFNGIGCIGSLVAARALVDGSPVDLGMPDQPLDETETCCGAFYDWTGKSVTVGPGQTLTLQLDFDNGMRGIRIDEVQVVVPGDNSPLPPGDGLDGDIDCTSISLAFDGTGSTCP